MLAAILPASVIAATENRIAGNDRYETAIAISRSGWTTAENVILSPAADANRTDTLSAAPLAKALGAPILLTDGRTLTPGTLAEIDRLGAANVYITSGTGVITPAVHEVIGGRGLTPVPLGGANRFETAVNIANEIGKHSPVTTVVFTSAQNDADALSMASLAAANGWVLFPAARDALAPAVVSWMSGQNVTQTYVIGSDELISEAAVASLPSVTRIGGADPYTNNVAILEHFADSFDYSRGLFITSGDDAHLVDAVTASAYLSGAPLFLAPPSVSAGSSAAAVLQNVIGTKTSVITAFGGTGAVSSSALTTVNQAASGTLPPATGGETPAATPPAPIPGNSGNNSLPVPGRVNLSYVDVYAVPQLGSNAPAVNYALLSVTSGDYLRAEYAINGAPVEATPVLTSRGQAAMVKIEIPSGVTAGTLTALQNGQARLTQELTGLAAGAAAPGVLYGEVPMAFSEFYHDITADITDVRPEATSFAAGGAVAQPAYFINGGTRTGNGPAGAGTLDTYKDADEKPAVDAVSSATYGDNPHFPPTGNLELNYPDPMTKLDANNKITNIKAVEVGVDFDLYANAYLLNAAQKATEQSTAVLAKAQVVGQKLKADTSVYAAKYLFPDASWGARKILNAGVASAWPSEPTVSASYGSTWADRIVSFTYSGPTSADLWSDYFEQLYGGYVEDLTTGQKEPLVWLQNLFSHRGHMNFEVALNRAGISRMNALTGNGDFKFVVYAIGLPDVVFELPLVDFAVSDASIEQGTTFYVDAAASEKHLLGANALPLEEGDLLHIAGLSSEALADFSANGGKLLKGTAEVSPAAYLLHPTSDGGEVEIELLASFFTGSFQGSYTASITPSDGTTIYQMPSFTVNAAAPLKPGISTTGSNYEVAADTATALTVNQGDIITFDEQGFAAAIVTSGRSVSTIALEPAENGVPLPAVTDVIKRSGGNTSPYIIDTTKLPKGKTYKITILTTNYAYLDGTFKTNPVYYVKVNS
jgi:hypothetical protein